MEAVLGHELTHIRNGDVQMMVVAVIIAGVVGFFGELLFRLFFNLELEFRRRQLVVIVVLVVLLVEQRQQGRRRRDLRRSSSRWCCCVLAWLLSQVVKLALSRSREFLADAGSVELTKNPDAMISALRKIENRGELPGATSAVMELCVDNPRSGFADLFATHPSVQARVDALVKFAGGHDPGPLALPPDGRRRADRRSAGAAGPSADAPEPPQRRRGAAGPMRSHAARDARKARPEARHGPVPGARCAASGRPPDAGRIRRARAIHRRQVSPASAELNSPLFLPCSRPKQGTE